MSDLSKFRPSKENQGVDIKTVCCDNLSSSFESLYNVYTNYCDDFPNGSWFPEFQRGLIWTQEPLGKFDYFYAQWFTYWFVLPQHLVV